jgi:segregation and condensation protein B
MDMLQQKIEAILFVAGEGLSVEFFSEKLGVKSEKVAEALLKLEKKYSGTSGVHLINWKTGKEHKYQFCSNPTVADAVTLVLNPVRERNLTTAALETMAIVAYKQPVTKLEIDEIRGVSSDYGVSILLQNNLIEVVGRKDALGKPLLYGTTDAFLKRFELKDINNLPSYEELMKKLKTVTAEVDLYGQS